MDRISLLIVFVMGSVLAVLIVWGIAWLVGLGYGSGFGFAERRGLGSERDSDGRSGVQDLPPEAAGKKIPATATETASSGDPGNPRDARLSAYRTEIANLSDRVLPPAELIGAPPFQEACAWAQTAYSLEELLELFAGENALSAIIALEAIRVHPEGRASEASIVEKLGRFVPMTFYFGIRTLFSFRSAEESVVGPLLCRADRSWFEDPRMDIYGDLASARVTGGEQPSFSGGLVGLKKEALERVESALQDFPPEVADPLTRELESHRESWIDVEFLETIGRVWKREDLERQPVTLPHEVVLREVEQISRLIGSDSPRSALVVGEAGVGKRSLLRALGRKLMDEGWTIFEAAAGELNAGQVWVGALEGRIQELVAQLRTGKKAVWFVPDFPDLLDTGKGEHHPTGALDALQSYFERGEILVVGLAEPGAYERLAMAKPRLASSLWVARIDPLPPEETRVLARAWSERRRLPDGQLLAADDVIEETCALAEQMREDTAPPGNVILLLRETHERVRLEEERPLEIGDVIETLSRRTGLPRAILDERIELDLESLRAYFTQRVVGQTEAVDCLVERIAMVKAGLTDPSRPLGVFFFVGPTGTGKTEIAKALATWLFGSESRLLRLDMSEIQTGGDLSRIYGDDGNWGSALIDQIRQQPFAVVLLDEFEKAHPAAWDLFLQAFDDGRLTDPKGRVASFRNAIVILTSNLGSEVPVGDSLGFVDTRAAFTSAMIQRSVEGVFRREFINRLDRVIAFLPLGRETMRQILHRELDLAFERRGLKQRRWAVEWDEGALEFLLGRGFTPDLGARPLRRAIERYLLEPLALTIVRHQVPHGDQFLFVRARADRLEVEFVDPDGPEPIGLAPEAPADTSAQNQSGEKAPAALLAPVRDRLEAVRAKTQAESWQASRQTELEMTSLPGFWDAPDRFELLGLFEYRDRVERALASSLSLLERLSAAGREDVPDGPLQLLAQRARLLEIAVDDVEERRPREAYLSIEAAGERGRGSDEVAQAGRRLVSMYKGWGESRGMRMLPIGEATTGVGRGEEFRSVFSVSGLGAFTLLSTESGLHLFEEPSPGSGSDFERVAVRVRVAPRPATPPPSDRGALAAEARAALMADENSSPSVVRRYRDKPSPLVRDAVRGWRTGRIDRVLAGEFDLLGQIEEGAPKGPASTAS